MTGAEIRLQTSCAHCHQSLTGEGSPHLCEFCKGPQPVQGNEDYFSSFQLEATFRLDRAALDRKFFALSRGLHPDRFSMASPELKRLSLDRMSLINNAYQTLSRPDDRRAYLLKLNGFLGDASSGDRTRKPQSMEWAERWFELQDDLENGSAEHNLQKITFFLSDLEGAETQVQQAIQQAEQEYDQSKERSVLARIEELLGKTSYFASLKRNAELTRSRLGADQNSGES